MLLPPIHPQTSASPRRKSGLLKNKEERRKKKEKRINKRLTYRRKYDTIEEVKADVFRYIKLFYNRKRLKDSLGYMSPADYRLAHSAG